MSFEVCECGNNLFFLRRDENGDCWVYRCSHCKKEHIILTTLENHGYTD